MYLENINETHVFSSFGTTFINSQAVNDVKTITFTEGYNLDSNLSFKVLFENGHNCTNASTPMTLNGKNIKVYIRGILSNLPIHTMTINNSTVYMSLQSGTILELYYNGSNFVVVGNPIIYSSDDYEIYANGDFIYKKKSYTNRITESGNNNVLLGNTSYSDNCYGDINVSNKCCLTFNPNTGVLTANTFCGSLNGTATTSTNACKGWNGSAFATFGSNAFNSTTIATKTSQLTNDCNFTSCTGTVTSVNISINGCSGTAITSSGTITLTDVPATNSTCFDGCTYAEAKADIRNYHPTISQKLGDIYYYCGLDSTMWTGCITPTQDSLGIMLHATVVKNSDTSVTRNVSMGVDYSCYSCILCCSSTICICEYCSGGGGTPGLILKSFCYCISDTLKNKSFFIVSTETCTRCALDMTFVHATSSTGWVNLNKSYTQDCACCYGCKFNANIYFVCN